MDITSFYHSVSRTTAPAVVKLSPRQTEAQKGHQHDLHEAKGDHLVVQPEADGPQGSHRVVWSTVENFVNFDLSHSQVSNH
jgi:methionine-rich copper-binding protein CopC